MRASTSEIRAFNKTDMAGPRMALLGLVLGFLGLMLFYWGWAAWNTFAGFGSLVILAISLCLFVFGTLKKPTTHVWYQTDQEGITILRPSRKQARIAWNDIVRIVPDDPKARTILLNYANDTGEKLVRKVEGDAQSTDDITFAELLHSREALLAGQEISRLPSSVSSANQEDEIGVPFSHRLFQIRSLEPRFRLLIGFALAQILIGAIAVTMPEFGRTINLNVFSLGRVGVSAGHLIIAQVSSATAVTLLVAGLYLTTAYGRSILVTWGSAALLIFFAGMLFVMRGLANLGVDTTWLRADYFIAVIVLLSLVLVGSLAAGAWRSTQAIRSNDHRTKQQPVDHLLYLWLGGHLCAGTGFLLAGAEFQEASSAILTTLLVAGLMICVVYVRMRMSSTYREYGFWLWVVCSAIGISVAWSAEWPVQTFSIIALCSVPAAASFGTRWITAPPSQRSTYVRSSVTVALAVAASLMAMSAISPDDADDLLTFHIGLVLYFWILCFIGTRFVVHRRKRWLFMPALLLGLMGLAIGAAQDPEPIYGITMIMCVGLGAIYFVQLVGVDWAEIMDSVSTLVGAGLRAVGSKTFFVATAATVLASIALPVMLDMWVSRGAWTGLGRAIVEFAGWTLVLVLILRLTRFRGLRMAHISWGSLVISLVPMQFLPFGEVVFVVGALALIGCCRGHYERFASLAVFWMLAGMSRAVFHWRVTEHIGSTEALSAVTGSSVADLVHATAVIAVVSVLTVIGLAMIMSSVHGKATVALALLRVNVAMLLLSGLAHFIYVPAMHVSEVSAMFGGIVLLIALAWDVITSGHAITNTENSWFSRSSRLCFFLAYVNGIVTIVVFFKHAEYLKALPGGNLGQVMPLVHMSLGEPESYVMQGIVNLGLPMCLTFFVLRLVAWYRMAREA